MNRALLLISASIIRRVPTGLAVDRVGHGNDASLQDGRMVIEGLFDFLRRLSEDRVRWIR